MPKERAVYKVLQALVDTEGKGVQALSVSLEPAFYHLLRREERPGVVPYMHLTAERQTLCGLPYVVNKYQTEDFKILT